MKKRILSLLVVLAMALPMTAGLTVMTASADSASTVVRLDPSDASPFNNGEFQGWGTSMGWWGNRIGYSDALSEQAAELLFSEKGLGLDIVRYNVGGGDRPEHIENPHVTRSDSKMPCFAVPELNEDNTPKKNEDGSFIYTYNWDADYNQVNALKKIKAANPDVHIEGYTNSPPWFMTNTLCSGGGTIHWTLDENGEHVLDRKRNWAITSIEENLDPANYDDFAAFLVDVTEKFDEWGLKFDSYSPMNEPNPAAKYWGENSIKQEGNHVSQGEHQAALIKAVKDAYTAADIDTLVAGPDETDIGYSVNAINALNGISGAMDNLDRIDTHTYGGDKRAQLKAAAISAGKDLWMSEVDSDWNALGLADRIILDVNGMQPSAWVMWDIIDKHKDSNFTDPSGNHTETGGMNPDDAMWGVAMANHDTQEIELSMKYYGYGQFTRYIHPGMTIIASSGNNLAAYDKKSGEIVIVAENNTNAEKPTTFDLRAFSKTASKALPIRTSGSFATGEKWAELEPITVTDKQFNTTLKANSITTFVVSDIDTAVTDFDATNEKVSYAYEISTSDNKYDKYFAVYDGDGVLRYVTKNQEESAADGDFTGCTYKLLLWDGMKPYKVISTLSQSKKNAVDYMTISGATTVVAGVEYNYTASLGSSEEAPSVTWSVSDDTVAGVTAQGAVTVKKGGSFTLKAEMADGTYTAIDINALDADQTIRIVNKNSGKGLETKSQGITSGTLVTQWDNRNLDTGAWKLAGTEDGHFNIINANADMLLVSDANQKPAISNTVLAADDAAKWDLINHGGYYEIKNVSVGKSLNVSGQSTANGGDVILYTFASGNNELWSFEAVDKDSLTHVEPLVVDYSTKYADTNYTYVSNVAAATDDFNDSASSKFVLTGDAAYGSDDDGAQVLFPQSVVAGKAGTNNSGTATLTLATPVTCDDSQLINLAFDMDAPNSLGDTIFDLTSSDNTELVKIVVNDWGNKYKVIIGDETVVTDADGSTYFKNKITNNTCKIANGGHVEVYYKPSTGAITVTVKSNTAADALQTYQGTVAAGKNIGKVYFEGTYTSWNRKMVVDNLVTNIITEKAS